MEHSLKEKVKISGAKNAAVAILPATLIAGEPCTIENLPNIEDVNTLVKMLEELGAKVTWQDSNTVTIDPRQADCYYAPHNLVKKITSIILLDGCVSI